MKTLIKFRKVVSGKIFTAMLLAACIIILSGCDQKRLVYKHEKVYESVEQMPEYQGGQQELTNFLVKSIRYPLEAHQNGIQGKVFVEFVVGKDGAVKDVKIAKSVDPALDAEAVRVVSNMPKWIPGKEKGKQVAVQYTIPINFALK